MGLFSFVKKTISSVFEAAAPLIQAAAPIAGAVLAAKFAPALGILGGVAGAPPVTSSNPVGFAGSCTPGANPITRAATSPGFNTTSLPSRPFQGFNAAQTQVQQANPVPQTTSFNQGAFGFSVSPTFRPFTPSFRSGQPSASGAAPGQPRGLDFGFSFGGF